MGNHAAPPPLPVLRRSSPTTSPVGRQPAWLTRLFPGIGDLSQNPLYIRLSNQGYGRNTRRRRISGPPEFSAPALDATVLTRAGLWPFIIALPPFILAFNSGIIFYRRPISYGMGLTLLWSFLYVTTRVILGRPRNAVINFFRRAESEPWGYDLIMAGFTSTDLKLSIFAAIVPRIFIGIFYVGAGWAFFILYVTLATFGGWMTDYGLFEHTTQVTSFWLTTWLLFSGLEIFDVALALKQNNIHQPPNARDPFNVLRAFLVNGYQLAITLAVPFLIVSVGSILIYTMRWSPIMTYWRLLAQGVIALAAIVFLAVAVIYINRVLLTNPATSVKYQEEP